MAVGHRLFGSNIAINAHETGSQWLEIRGKNVDAKRTKAPQRQTYVPRKPEIKKTGKTFWRCVPLEVYFSCAAIADKLELAKGFEPPTL